MMKPIALLIALLPLCAQADSGSADDSIGASLRSALEKHLATQGAVCLGKFDWPIEVSQQDFQSGTRDAVQMPVLEELGVVASSQQGVALKDAESGKDVTVTSYAMTDTGRRYYLEKQVTTGTGAQQVEHHRDLCPVRLSLDRITSWEEPRAVGGASETLLNYTYKVEAADWTHAPAAQKVFPMLDRIIKGAGSLQLQQRMRSTKDGWVAVGPQGT